jgi:hypothetical protein
MKKVKDLDGTVMRGAYKTDTGSIVIKDDAALRIYHTKKNAASRTLSELDEVKAQLQQLQLIVNKIQKDNNG